MDEAPTSVYPGEVSPAVKQLTTNFGSLTYQETTEITRALAQALAEEFMGRSIGVSPGSSLSAPQKEAIRIAVTEATTRVMAAFARIPEAD